MKHTIKTREFDKTLKQSIEILKKKHIDSYYVVFPLSWYKAYKDNKGKDFWAIYKQRHPDTDYYFISSLGKNRITYKLNEEGELEKL